MKKKHNRYDLIKFITTLNQHRRNHERFNHDSETRYKAEIRDLEFFNFPNNTSGNQLNIKQTYLDP